MWFTHALLQSRLSMHIYHAQQLISNGAMATHNWNHIKKVWLHIDVTKHNETKLKLQLSVLKDAGDDGKQQKHLHGIIVVSDFWQLVTMGESCVLLNQHLSHSAMATREAENYIIAWKACMLSGLCNWIQLQCNYTCTSVYGKTVLCYIWGCRSLSRLIYCLFKEKCSKSCFTANYTWITPTTISNSIMSDGHKASYAAAMALVPSFTIQYFRSVYL